MKQLRLSFRKIYFQVATVGTVLLVLNMCIIGIGLSANLMVQPAQQLMLGVYLAVVFVFLLMNLLMAYLLWKNGIILLEQESSAQQAHIISQRSTNQLQVAAEIARDATAQADLQGLLDHSVQLICERFEFYHAGIFLIDQESGYAVIRAAYGTEASQDMLRRGHKLKVGEEGIVGYVTSTGQPRIVLDIDKDTYHYKNPVLPKTRSELSLPFRVGDDIIGALDVQSLHRDAFDEDDISILQTMADLLAVAIDKAYLNEKVQAYADELEIRVQQRTKQLEDEHAQLQAIIESMSDGVIYDQELEAVYTNKALARLTGYTHDEWHGVLSLLKPDDMTDEELKSIEQELYDAIGNEGIWKREMKLARADGTEFDASIISSGVQHNPINQTVLGAVTIIRDISQRKALDEQKSRFIANAAHELRTPLTNMKTRLYLIEQQPERFTEHHEIMRRVTTRMQRLIDDLLDMSRFEQGWIQLSLEPCHVQALIHDVVRTQRPEAEAKSIQLIEDLTEIPIKASLDMDRMVQVLTNLLSNAINYTETGTVTVHLRPLPDRQFEICVEDTGIGIEPDMLENIFQPFIRVNHDTSKGTGLGLHIAYEIIERHGGELTVESDYGKGSKFIVRMNQA